MCHEWCDHSQSKGNTRGDHGYIQNADDSSQESFQCAFSSVPMQLTTINTAIQSDAVTGEISLTCDAWQASNTDGYFAVTGHWIEESRPGVWERYIVLYSDSQGSTMLTMGGDLAVPCLRLLTDLALLIEYVYQFNFKLALTVCQDWSYNL